MNKIDWLNALRRMYDTNPVQAILKARIEYAQLDDEALTLLGFDARQLADQQYRDEVVNTAMGILGSPEQPTGAMAAHQAREFALTMGMIGIHKGDPPATTKLRNSALDILSGRLSIDEQLTILDTIRQERNIGQIASVEMMKLIAGPDWHLMVTELISPYLQKDAALSLPRQHLCALMGVQEQSAESAERLNEQDKHELARKRFIDEMAKGQSEVGSNPGKAFEHFLLALKNAAVSPEPENDNEALLAIAQLLYSKTIPSRDYNRIIEGIRPFIHNRQVRPVLSSILILLATKATDTLVDDEFIEGIAEIISDYIQLEDINQELNVGLSVIAINLWRKIKKPKLAWSILQDIERKGYPKKFTLSIALVKADLLADDGSMNEACDLLREILTSTESTDKCLRAQVIQKLLEYCKEFTEDEKKQWRIELKALQSDHEGKF